MSRPRRLLVLLAIPVMLLAVLAGTSVLVFRSQGFQAWLRQRIVREVERASGGKASLEAFSFDWKRMRVELRGFVLRGREAPHHPPLFRAASIAAGLSIQSLWPRKVSLALLEIDQPALHVLVDARGRTNFPSPEIQRTGRKPVERFVDLAVAELRLRNGWLRYNSQAIPLDVEGRHLILRLFYEKAAPRYFGQAAVEGLQVSSGRLLLPVRWNAGIFVSVERNHIRFSRTVLKMPRSELQVDGAVNLVSPVSADIRARGEIALADVGAALRLPVEHRGSVALDGEFHFGGGRPFTASGTARATQVAVKRGPVHVEDISAAARWTLSREGAGLDGLEVAALGGRFLGSATVERFRSYRVAGQVELLPSEAITRALGSDPVPYSASLAGPVEFSGNFGSGRELEFRVGADWIVSRGGKGIPLDGALQFRYDSRAAALRFELATLRTDNTRLSFRGDAGRRLEVAIHTRKLADFEPALRLAGLSPSRLPLELRNGACQFEGTLSGGLRHPEIRGRLQAESFSAGGRTFQAFSTRLQLNSSLLSLRELSLRQGRAAMGGNGRVELRSWRVAPDSAIAGELTLQSAELETLLAEAGVTLPAAGILSGSLSLSGTYARPRGQARISVLKPVLWEESFDRLAAELHYQGEELRVASARFEKGPAVATLVGSYRHQPSGWRSGRLEAEVSGARFALTAIHAVQRYRKRIEGTLAWKFRSVVRLENGSPSLQSLDGELVAQNISLDKRPLGRIRLDSLTRGRVMTVSLESRMVDSLIRGKAEWSLNRNSFGLGQLQVSRMTFATMQDLGLLGDPDKPLPFQGFIEAELGFSGPVLHPQSWTAAAKLTRIEVSPNPENAAAPVREAAANGEALTLRNQEPLLAYVTSQGVTVQSARIISRHTDVEATGTVAFRARNPWNLQLRGTLQLAVISLFEPDLVAGGLSTVDGMIRGSLTQPQVTGRLELKDASFYLRGVPNGIEKANGVIRFDRSRATIEQFSAQTGGGDLKLSGFVGFGGPELVYRLQADARRVRVRYPSSVSTTFNARLNLTGTQARSLLDGELTVTRMGLNPQTDFGGLLAESARTRPSQFTSSPFLRGMQLNVRVRTSDDAELLTSLTRDVQPEASLQLRGTAARTILLGRVTVNQGEIQFFGNRYTITRGEASFFNPVKIEPVLDVDLETRVRGITVTINLSGPFNRLNVSYRSDPPLQSTEIVALLAVGRAPGSAVGTPNTAGTQSAGYLQAGGNSLLGQAIATPISGRLQRFFGVSRLKIDPELTGVSNTPQARVTIEQQLSRDITVTYITNLNRSQQQVVRLQWDFSKDFSVLAVREENGVFGVDFQYRRRFK